MQPGDSAHRWPSFLTDGDHFLYLAQSNRANELRLGSLKAPAETRVLGLFESGAYFTAGHLLFVRDRRLMAQPFDSSTLEFKGDPTAIVDDIAVVVPWQRGQFSASEAGALAYSRVGRPLYQLTWMDRDGKELGSAGEPGYYNNVDLSRDDGTLAVSRATQQPGMPWNFDIWTIDLTRNTMKRITTDPAREFDPAWSPDGNYIAFASNRTDGVFGLFRRSVGGLDDEELLKPKTGVTGPSWSPHDVLIFNFNAPERSTDLYTLSLSGSRDMRPYLNTPFRENAGEFSRDGRWIAFESDVSGRGEVHLRPYPQGKEEVISREGGRAPRWKGDGSELFFLAPDGTLMSSTLDTRSSMRPAAPTERFKTPIFSFDNNHPYAVASNGQRFLIPVPLNPPGPAPITVLLNWTARLKR